MYAEVTVKLRSIVEQDKLSKDVETLQTLNLDMSCSLEQFQTALHTLVSQNVTELMKAAFDQHPTDANAVREELKATAAKKAKAEQKKKDEDAAGAKKE